MLISTDGTTIRNVTVSCVQDISISCERDFSFVCYRHLCGWMLLFSQHNAELILTSSSLYRVWCSYFPHWWIQTEKVTASTVWFSSICFPNAVLNCFEMRNTCNKTAPVISLCSLCARGCVIQEFISTILAAQTMHFYFLTQLKVCWWKTTIFNRCCFM